MEIDIVVEGILDEQIARKIIRYCQHSAGVAYGKHGWSYLQDKVKGFNTRARYGNPILMLVDFMDTQMECPAQVPQRWLPQQSDKMLLRVAVREIESWLLADQEGMARFLRISPALFPNEPENEADPKRALVNLARKCRNSNRRGAIVPRPNTSASEGREYNSELGLFVRDCWDITAASAKSISLAKCVKRLRKIGSE